MLLLFRPSLYNTGEILFLLLLMASPLNTQWRGNGEGGDGLPVDGGATQYSMAWQWRGGRAAWCIVRVEIGNSLGNWYISQLI